MKVYRPWLQRFFDAQLPPVADIADALTFHSSEIEETHGEMLDVKVLPDKAAWMLSHRGIAKDLSTILGIPLTHDPLAQAPDLSQSGSVTVELKSPKCRRYTAAYITGVSVKESPAWLKESLEAVGQRSINNVVDATNYVMFHMGQPSHAFDVAKLSGKALAVRDAKSGEKIMGLDGIEYTLSSDDLVIVDGVSDTPVGIGGVKGGQAAEITESTKDVIIEAANFDPVSVRKTSQRLKLRTDASARFENGIVPDLAGYGVAEVARLITEIAGGTIEGYTDVSGYEYAAHSVSLPISKLNSVIGITFTEEDVRGILDRFGYTYTIENGIITVTAPFERTDFVIQEDLIEEIGRIRGYDVPVITPEPIALAELNARFFYSQKLRAALTGIGFSEVYTSSFREKDSVKMANAFASDKGYLRSALRSNLDDALAKNAPNADLLGVKQVKIFEIGTVFPTEGEKFSLALGVRSPSGFKAKTDDPALQEGLAKVAEVFGSVPAADMKDGIAEIDFGKILETLVKPTAYMPFEKTADALYKPFSMYPFVSRDVALWTPSGTSAEDVAAILEAQGGELLNRVTLFDVFEKDGKTSYAFRLVFQSYEKTLSDTDVNPILENVQGALKEKGWEVR